MKGGCVFSQAMYPISTVQGCACMHNLTKNKFAIEKLAELMNNSKWDENKKNRSIHIKLVSGCRMVPSSSSGGLTVRRQPFNRQIIQSEFAPT